MRKFSDTPHAAPSENKGFYIILVLCLTAVALSGYVLFFSPASEPAKTIDSAVYAPDITQEEIAAAAGLETNESTISPSDSNAASTAQTPASVQTAAVPETDSADTAIANADEPASYTRPVSGAIQQAYSDDVLVFSPTFDDWRVHNGIDYAAALGDHVYAIADGTVENVSSDELYGTCVTLSHADNLTSIYHGLGEDVSVSAGDTLQAGDAIGVVGNTDLSESTTEPHLHLETLRDGVHIDPESLFEETLTEE